MKQLILSLILIGGMTLTASAQSDNMGPNSRKDLKNASPEEKAKFETQKATQKLGLTADQTAKWETASLNRIKANEPYRQKMQGSTTPEERKELQKNMRTNKEAFDKSVTAFLTPDQKTKWDSAKKDRKAWRMNKGNGGKRY